MFISLFPYLPPPIHMIRAVLTPIMMPHVGLTVFISTHWPHPFNSCILYILFFTIPLYTNVYHRLYVHFVMIWYIYLIVCFIFNLLLQTYPFPYAWLPLLGMWRWLTTCSSPFTLHDLWGFPGSSPIGDLPWSHSFSLIAMFFIHFPLSTTPYPYDQGCINPHYDATCRPHILHIHFMLSSHIYFTLSFYTSYVVDCMYTHVIFP